MAIFSLKMRIKIFYHIFFGIIISSIISTIGSFFDIHKIKSDRFSVVNELFNHFLNNPLYRGFAIFSGINTGYGFYGINISTHKYFEVELFDGQNCLISSTKDFGIERQNNLIRFEVLASKMANFISENKEFELNENDRVLEIRKLYVEKIFKYVGKYEAKKDKKCLYYRTTLYSLMPSDIWIDHHYNRNITSFIYESIYFDL